MMLSLRHIEVFRAVMVAKSINAAARLLNVSQPGLSRTVRHMQDRIGFRLFDRVNGRLSPTREAHALFLEVESVYERLEELDGVVRDLKAGGRSEFCVGAAPSVSRWIAPRALRQVLKTFPEVSTHLDVLCVDEVVDYLMRSAGQAVVTVFPPEHPNIVSRKLGVCSLVCIAHRDNRLAARTTVSIQDVASEPLVSFRRATPHGKIVHQMFAVAEADYHVASYVRSAESACALVAQDIGVAIVDELTGGSGAPDLQVIELEGGAGRIPLYLCKNKFADGNVILEKFETEVQKAVNEALSVGVGGRGR